MDHNKPIIVPAGQDSFSQIGESGVGGVVHYLFDWIQGSETSSAAISISFIFLFHSKPFCTYFFCLTLP